MPKGVYGQYHLRPLISIFENVTQRMKSVISVVPLSFEAMGINSGFIMYETTLLEKLTNVSCKINLIINTIRDRAIVYLDQVDSYWS